MRKISKGGVQGATFGVMEGTIMMLGVLMGLSVTGDRFIISLGLLTAGIADAFANSASFYVSEESEMIHTRREIWKSARLCFAGTFLTVVAVTAPVVFIANINYAIVASFVIGMLILLLLGRYMARKLGSESPQRATVKYIAIGFLTAVICFILGELVEFIAAAA